ncbi:MAG TPA: hypothetical protein VL460_01755 [Caulobacteraceae bacterium]|jgi:hypothetical protein|nr:hypothetical protein [Caulobacteraceae bacterium]
MLRSNVIGSGRRRSRLADCAAAALSMFLLGGGTAHAQWSIGPPGPREAAPGLNRYLYLVASTPLPGLEQAFNEAYQNQHMGDLLQLDGWVGAQRFRLATDGQPRSIPGSRYGYLIVWEQEGASPPPVPIGGKNRRIPGYDFTTPDANWQATYKVVGPRKRRPDGRGPFMPAASDTETPRPNRYVLMEFDDPPPGVGEADFEATLDRRIDQVLAVPGWMAAQRLRLEPTPQPVGRPARPPSPADRYLIVWETEGRSAQALQDALLAAVKAGKVEPFVRDPATAQSTYWQPISPYVTKDDIER